MLHITTVRCCAALLHMYRMKCATHDALATQLACCEGNLKDLKRCLVAALECPRVSGVSLCGALSYGIAQHPKGQALENAVLSRVIYCLQCECFLQDLFVQRLLRDAEDGLTTRSHVISMSKDILFEMRLMPTLERRDGGFSNLEIGLVDTILSVSVQPSRDEKSPESADPWAAVDRFLDSVRWLLELRDVLNFYDWDCYIAQRQCAAVVRLFRSARSFESECSYALARALRAAFASPPGENSQWHFLYKFRKDSFLCIVVPSNMSYSTLERLVVGFVYGDAVGVQMLAAAVAVVAIFWLWWLLLTRTFRRRRRRKEEED